MASIVNEEEDEEEDSGRGGVLRQRDGPGEVGASPAGLITARRRDGILRKGRVWGGEAFSSRINHSPAQQD